MDKVILRSKFLGSLVGTGVGDALGVSLEGRLRVDPDEVKTIAERHRILAYTDDTHMMIGVAESLIENGGFDGEHMTLRFMENFQREPWRGYGPGPPRVFRLIRSGRPWNKAAEELYPGGSFGNGSAMRIAPIGAFYYDDLEKLREVAYKSSQITHTHRLGKEGAALQACSIALATQRDPSTPLDSEEFLAQLSEFMLSDLYKRRIERIGELLSKGADRGEVIAHLGNGIEAFNSVPTAIYSFLSHPDSFEESVLYAISLGGDTDTIAAMTGAIAGSYHGIEVIPDRWKEKLENRHYIENLAERLWEVYCLQHQPSI